MKAQTIHLALAHLRYELEEIKALTSRPCWIFFEYKSLTLVYGIQFLESVQDINDPGHREEIKTLLTDYREAFKNM